MSASNPTARQRMIASAATLIREKGASATSLDDVLERSGAPRGSIYHHFPGGRAQLIEEAISVAGQSVARVIAEHADASPVAIFDALVAALGSDLEASNFRAGCPVLAVAVEANDQAPQLAVAAARAFDGWCDALAALLERHGISPSRARRLAVLAVASVEGAVVLSRVRRSLQPIEDIRREVGALIRHASEVAPARTGRRPRRA